MVIDRGKECNRVLLGREKFLVQRRHESRRLRAREFADERGATLTELFRDEKTGGFFFTSSDHEALFARGKNPIDGALPSGNSVAASNLLLLARALKKPALLPIAQKTISSSAGILEQSPSSAPRMAIAIPLLLEQMPAEKKPEPKEEEKSQEKKK